jgi:capsular exopolysaccharide synthesis family protein
MGRIADALKRSKTGVVSRQRPGSPSDADAGLRFLGSEQSHVVGPWVFDDDAPLEPLGPTSDVSPVAEAPAPPPPAPKPTPTASPTPAPATAVVTQARKAAAPLSLGAAASSRLVISANMADIAREQYRRLAAGLQEVQAERGTKVVMVTSALTDEGKTLTAANLALTLAESFNRQVALIEADLRRPAIHELFGLNGGSQSVSELFADGPVPLVQIRPTLSVFAPSDRIADPITALSSTRMRQILEAVRAKFDWVVLDTPPVGLLPDAHVLSSLVDGVVLVVAAGRTGYPAAQRACQVIGAHRVIGVVLNRAERRALDSSAEDYHQYYADDRTT